MNNKKKMLIIVIICIAASAVGGCGWYFGIKVPKDRAFNAYKAQVTACNEALKPYNDAVSAYNSRVSEIASANSAIEEIISSAQEAVNSGETPYEPGTVSSLSLAISDVRQEMVTVPEKKAAISDYTVSENDQKASAKELNAKTAAYAGQAEKINTDKSNVEKETKAMKVPDYTVQTKKLQDAEKALEDSIAIEKQIICPDESFVIARLQEIPDVQEVGAVTEDNDPNGQLNKPGGYTSTVYFSVSQVNQDEVDGNDIIEKGTWAGGAVETYTTAEDAQKRCDYLAQYDGGIFASGSHKVLGTMLLRTSDELTASGQKELEQKMISVLTELKN